MSLEKIIFKLENNADKETALKTTAEAVLAKLKSQFEHEYHVTANEFGTLEKSWSHEIKVRKGNKIGAEVSFKWEETQPDAIELDVDESSKFGWQLTYVILGVFAVAGAYLGYNNMEPLAFLPGKKIACGLGALIAFIPGLVVLSIAKSIFMKNEKEHNTRLVSEVRQAVSDELVFTPVLNSLS